MLNKIKYMMKSLRTFEWLYEVTGNKAYLVELNKQKVLGRKLLREYREDLTIEFIYDKVA